LGKKPQLERTKPDLLALMAVLKRDDLPDGLTMTRIQKWLKKKIRYEQKRIQKSVAFCMQNVIIMMTQYIMKE